MEEVLGQATTLSPDRSHLLAFIAETPLENPAAVMLIELPLRSSELVKRIPINDEFMPGTLAFLSVDPDEIAMTLCRADQMPTHLWHPTARYRLIALMLHRFGHDATIRALSQK